MSLRSHRWLLVAAGVLLLAGCGLPGAPQPPSLGVPKPVDDLTASRKGDRVVLTWTPPTQTTDGENIRHAGVTEICRGVNESSMTQCSQKVAALNDAQVEHWTKGAMPSRVDYTDTLPASLEQQSPLGEATYALEDFNNKGRAAGLSNEVHVPLAPTLPPPPGITAKVTADGVLLSWDETAKGLENPSLHYFYRVFRQNSGNTKAPEVIAGEVPVTDEPTASFVDRNIEWEQTYLYRVAPMTQVTRIGAQTMEVEGDDSPPVEVFAHDIFPPATPTGLQAVYSGVGQKPFIDLTWAPNLENDLAGYNVYRHEQGTAPVKINSELVKTPSFRDTDVEPGQQYFYAVTAVDQRSNESGKSEETSEKVPE